MIELLLKRLARALKSYRIPYMIVGGQAVLFYGYPRLTRDVDVTLGVDIDAWNRIEEVCRRADLKPLVKEPQVFLNQTRVLPTQDLRSSLRVDFIFSNTPYERQAVRKARRVRIGKVEVRMAALEDLLIHKLVAGRAVDIEDVRLLMTKRRGEMDVRYLRRWLKQFSELGILKDDPLASFNRLFKEIG